MIKKFISAVLMVGLIAINFGSLFVAPRVATAAALTVMSDTVTNLSAGQVANHVIKFTTPTTIPVNGTFTLTFDNGTSIPSGLDYTDIDLTDDGTDLTLAAAPSSSSVGVVRTSALILTFTLGSTVPISASSIIIIEIGTNATYAVTGDQQITNGTAGTTVLRVVTSVPDSGVISMAIVSNGVVLLNAEVLSALSFSISDNTIYFGNLKSSGTSCWAQGTDPGFVTCPQTAEYEAFNMTAGTNASTGYTISVQGATLTAGANTITALAASTAPSVGSEQFGIRIDESGGVGTVNATYGTAGQYAFTANATTPAAVATAAGPSATTTYSTKYMANISPVTEPGSYTTAHTYIATGNF